MTFPSSRAWGLAATLAAALSLAACGGAGGDDAPAHDEPHLETEGRLAVLSDGAASVRILDLDSQSVTATFPLANVPSAVYASPDRRYALAVQRTQDVISFIDGGVWQEDHGDHLHDYKEAPALLTFALTGVRPTHYESHEGQAAVFMDGLDPAAPAEAVLLTDAAIGAGKADARLTLPSAMHGTAEPRGDYLLTTYRTPGATSTLPAQVELYRRDGAGYAFVQRFAETCPDLHGSFSNEKHTAFGCSDGVLVVTQAGDVFTARKLANPADTPAGVRIGTLVGHHGLDGFVGIASPGRLYAIDPTAGTIAPIAWAEGRTRRAHAFDVEGENFLVLDDQGVLHLLDVAAGFAVRATLPAIAAMPAAAPFPSIAVSHAADRAFISDPQGRAIVVVDTAARTLASTLRLDFSPSGLAWLGVEGHSHD